MHIWIIWATNVGKSTLFNRLIGQFRAIVTDIPGTTTDIINHRMQLEGGETLTFFDSPGLLDFTDELPYIMQIVKDSDLLLFVIDDTVGITAKEQHILEIIRKEKKSDSTILVVNKLDVKRKETETDLALSEYYDLGITNVIGVSAKKERNLEEIHDTILPLLKGDKGGSSTRTNEPPLPPAACAGQALLQKEGKLAILGKPNAGKSTLLNTLVGKELAKVSDTAGTTRDYLVGEFTYKGKTYTAYDTAGIKKKGQIHGIEKIAYDKTKAMLEYLRPVVVFMIDCTQGITHRDMTLLQEIHSLALPIIFVLNKVDQINPKGMDAMIKNAQSYLEFAKYIPIVPMIATTGQGIEDVMKMVALLQKENQKRVWTRELNQALQHEMIQRPPRFPKNKIAKILYATQIAVDAPTFVLFVNHKSRVNFAFKKRVENTIRKHFGFIGVPIVTKYRNRGESWMDTPPYEGGIKGGSEDWMEIDEGTSPTSRSLCGTSSPSKGGQHNANNPYNNKGKRKREKKSDQLDSKPLSKPSTTKSNEPRKNEPHRTNEPRRDASIKRPNETKKPNTKKTPTPTKRTPPKREGKYFNTKKGSQKKLDEIFTKVYGEKKSKKRK